MAYQKLKGTLDFFGKDAKEFRYIENVARKEVEAFGFSEVITPIFESTDLFLRSVGETSDIVTKEMYTFLDKGERSLTLRPEGTASIARLFIENKLYINPGLKKYYYFGPMFRYERPQAGRYRQFHQFGAEVYGDLSPYINSEVILSAYNILQKLGIKNIVLKINTIGDFESRNRYSIALKEYFKDNLNDLCDDCKARYEKNPMRILDCKIDKNNPILLNAPKIKDYLTLDAKENFNKVQQTLKAMNIPFVCDDSLVRGLDYYTDLVFEFINLDDGLAICAGGQYAEMIKSFGGPDLGGIGYAFGVERVKNVMESDNLFPELEQKTDVVIISLDDESKISALNLMNKLRDNGISSDMDYTNNNLKPQFKLVDRLNPKAIVIIGEAERLNKEYNVKNNITKNSELVKEENIIDYIKKMEK